MTDKELAEKIVREVFRFDIPDNTGGEIGVLAFKAVYSNMEARKAITDRIYRAILNVREAARQDELV